MLGLQQAGIHKKCGGKCKKVLPVVSFGTRILKGEEVVFSACPPCRAKSAARVAKYSKTPKAATVQQRYRGSEKSKARLARYYDSEKGTANVARKKATEKVRRRVDTSYSLKRTIRSASQKLVQGCYKKSAAFVERTSFKSAKHFISHLEENLPHGMEMADHGKKDGWEIEHSIPVEAYDFSIPEDVKRCWSPSNVRGATPEDNKTKSWFIIDELCMHVGAANFPLSWKGILPTAAEKEVFYSKCRAGWSEAGPSMSVDEPSEEEQSDSDEDSD